MSDNRYETTTTTTGPAPVSPQAQPHTTTVVERRGSGSGMLIGLAVLIAVIVGAYFLLNQSNSSVAKDTAITQAADKVGDAADKAGDAIDGATK